MVSRSPEIIAATAPATYTAQWIPRILLTGDIIEYGTYPQTKVTDTGLIDVLNSETLSPDNTVTYGVWKYLRVYLTHYTTLDGGTSTDPNDSKQDENGYFINTVYWFRFDPIQWRVLSNAAGELFVMAEKILDSNQYYNSPYTDVTWETSTIRSWLNNEFFDFAFDSAEQSAINTSLVINSDNPDYETLGGNDTNDKVFLLSQSETSNPTYGFNANYNNSDSSREAIGTDFSKCQGLYVIDFGESADNSLWWLRTPGYYQNHASYIDTDGWGGRSEIITSAYIGIRPAFKCSITM